MARTLFGIVFCLGLLLGASASIAADTEARLKQAAQHFVDLEDDQAKAILEELSAEGVTDADVLLGYLYSDPLYIGRSYTTTVNALRRGVAAGNEEAMFQLAEARFWPDYSRLQLTQHEKSVAPTLEESFELLRRSVGDGARLWGDSGAPYWRLAWLCTFGGYDCGKDVTDEAVRKGGLQKGNLRMITGAYQVIRIQQSGKMDSPGEQESLSASLALGLAAADPFVATLGSGAAWSDAGTSWRCPEQFSMESATRMLALIADAVPPSNGWVDIKRCFDTQQLWAIWDYLVVSLDNLIRDHKTQNAWHLLTCYQDPNAPTFGDCLIHAVRDHYFVCTKLSQVDYFRIRYKIDYTATARYGRCREHMLSARTR